MQGIETLITAIKYKLAQLWLVPDVYKLWGDYGTYQKLFLFLGLKWRIVPSKVHLSLALRRGYVPKKYDANWNDAKWIRIFYSKPCKVRRWVPGLQKYYFLKRKFSKEIIKKIKITLHFITYYTYKNKKKLVHLKQNKIFNYILNYEK